ncbi:MAG: sulfatase [Planctomycetaceae bacterium]|jgi:arylsulfatase A-like enzyme|nr:sulfatase [Planctomycetaceae bacterium]
MRFLFFVVVFFSFYIIFPLKAAGENTKPNIVFILADDLGVMDIGAFNPNTFYETPNIDRLAAEGMKFTTAYAACCVCSPTRYSIMTGRYPVRSGITNFLAGKRSERFEPAALDLFMPLEETTLGEAFHEAGYKTALLGKWHLGNPKDYGPQFQGFDVVSGDIRYIAPSVTNLTLPNLPPINKKTSATVIETRTTQITDDALLVLDAFKDSPKDSPFLLYLSFYQVHVPLGTSEEYVAPYRDKKQKLNLQNDEARDFTEEEQVHLSDQPRKTRCRQNHEIYAGMISHTDACVGRVLAKLKELGLDENTVVVFMSDNGGLATAEGLPTSNLPFRTGKGWNYEGGIREPLIVRWSKTIQAGSVCNVPVISTDFYPTLLDLAKLPLKPEQHLDGISFASLLKGEKTLLKRDALFWHYPHYSNQGGFPSSAVRVGDYKLIQRLEDGRVHLFNVTEDMGEQTDLAEKMPEKTKELQKLLFHWYQDTGARFLEPKNGQTPWKPQ